MQEVGRKPILERLADEEKARAARKESDPHDDAEKALAEQTPGSTPSEPRTAKPQNAVKLTRRPEPAIRLAPADNWLHAEFGPSDVGAMHRALAVLRKAQEHATDGTQLLAEAAADPLMVFLALYPVKWVDPKPKKKPAVDAKAAK